MRPIDKDTQARIEAEEVLVQKFMRGFQKFLDNSLDDILEGLEEGDISAQAAAGRLGSLYQQLLAKGLDKELAKIDKLYASKLRDVAIELEGISPGARMSDVDLDFASTLVDFDAKIIQNKVLVVADSIKSATIRQVLSPEPLNTKAIREQFGTQLGHQIETEIRTGVSSFHQTLINTKAQELGLTLFAYVGPLDSITRPICEHILTSGGVYMNAERANFTGKYGSTLPVEIYGGGYNCRHQWSPIDLEDARQFYGYNG